MYLKEMFYCPAAPAAVILLTMSSLIPAVLSVPANPSTITKNLTAPSNPGDQFRCFERELSYDPKAPDADCARALMNFPKSTSSGEFSRTAVLGQNKLPKQQIWGGCAVTITTQTVIDSDISSWAALTAFGTQLILGCNELDVDLSSHTGGTMAVGNAGNLKITIGTSGPGLERNQTGSAATHTSTS